VSKSREQKNKSNVSDIADVHWCDIGLGSMSGVWTDVRKSVAVLKSKEFKRAISLHDGNAEDDDATSSLPTLSNNK
jgi:hypothetical protein